MEKKAHVIACIDGATLSESVCDYAAWIAQKTQAPLNLLHTIDHHHETAANTDLTGKIGLGSQEHLLEEIINQEHEQSKIKLQKGKQLLQAAKTRAQQSGVAEPICSQRHGSLIESLIENENDIRVLVLGLRGQVHDQQPNQIGAKLETIVRSLHKPILIVNKPYQEPNNILLAYDGSEASEKAVDMVAASPLYHGLTCHLVCVNNNPDKADDLLKDAEEKLKANKQLTLKTVKLSGKVEIELCNYQEQNQIDLTIMGAFSHNRLHDMILGSFTHKMLLGSKAPLLLLR